GPPPSGRGPPTSLPRPWTAIGRWRIRGDHQPAREIRRSPSAPWCGVSYPGSQFERFDHSLGQVIFGHRGVDLDGSQFEALRLRAEELGELSVTVEQVTQGSFRIAGLAGD